jgi:division protein 1
MIVDEDDPNLVFSSLLNERERTIKEQVKLQSQKASIDFSSGVWEHVCERELTSMIFMLTVSIYDTFIQTVIQSELGQVAASIETLVARQKNLQYKLSKLSEREDDLADTCKFGWGGGGFFSFLAKQHPDRVAWRVQRARNRAQS